MGIEAQSSSLVELLQRRAQAAPEGLAYEMLRGEGEVEQRLTFAALDRQAQGIAAALLERARPGDRALLLYHNGVEFLAAFFGCLYAGVIGVPLYPPRLNKHLSRLTAVARDCAPRLILACSGNQRHMESLLATLPPADRPSLLEADTIAPAAAGEVWRGSAHELAFLQYTSGSTGIPKGVMVSHANLLHNLGHMQRGFRYDAHSHMVSWLPVHHDLGLIFGVLLPLYGGFPATLLLPAAFVQRPYRWLKAISDSRATTTGAPNFAFELCVDAIGEEERRSLDLSSLRQVLNAAEPVRASTLQRFAHHFADCGFRAESFNPCYGMAEATLLISMHQGPDRLTIDEVASAALERGQVQPVAAGEEGRPFVGCGSGFADQAIRIVDPQTLQPLPDQQIGELWVRGPSVCRGYWGREEATAEAFGGALAGAAAGAPFLRTGDLAYVREGQVFIAGRLKDLIIVRGNNHYPQDIEYTVQDCWQGFHSQRGAAFAIERDGEERLVVVQEVARVFRDKIDPEQIGRQVGNAIAQAHELKLDRLVVVRPASIPLTSSGKIQRRLTKQLWLADELEVIAQWGAKPEPALAATPRSPAQGELFRKELKAWLREELAAQFAVPLEAVPLNEPYAYLGFDSLIATAVASKLGRFIGHEVEANCFFDYPTLEALSGWLVVEYGADGAGLPPPVPAKRGGRGLDLDAIEQMSDEEAELLLREL